MSSISFFVVGTPEAQPRPRAGRAHPVINKATGQQLHDRFGKPIWRSTVHDPSDADAWKAQVKLAVRPFLPLSPIAGPVQCDCAFYFPRPQDHYGTGKNLGKLKASAPKYCQSRPDLDNCIKAIWDALTDERLWLNDSQVVKTWSDKFYEVPPTIKPGVQIVITELETKVDPSEARHVFTELPQNGDPNSLESLDLFNGALK